MKKEQEPVRKRLSESPIKTLKKLDVTEDRESKTSLDKKNKKDSGS